MGVLKTTNFGNPHIGLFARASERMVAADASASPKFFASLGQFGADIFPASFGASGLVGVFLAMNSNGAVVPSFADAAEISELKRRGLNVATLPGRFSAAGNNISANDFGAVANPEIPRESIRRISDCLGVEVVPRAVAGYLTAGSCLLATNKGFLAHNRAGEEELKELQSILHVGGTNSTLNAGVAFVSICAIANSRAALVGEASTGFEVGRAAGELGFV